MIKYFTLQILKVPQSKLPLTDVDVNQQVLFSDCMYCKLYRQSEFSVTVSLTLIIILLFRGNYSTFAAKEFSLLLSSLNFIPICFLCMYIRNFEDLIISVILYIKKQIMHLRLSV